MLRLAHRILSTPGTPVMSGWEQDYEWHKKVFHQTREDLPSSVIVCATNVWLFWSENDKDWWDYGSDFPKAVPPFPRMFVEFDLVGRMESFLQCGWDIRSFRGKWPIMGDLFSNEESRELRNGLQETDTAIAMSMFGTHKTGLPFFTGGMCLFVVNGDGEMKGNPQFKICLSTESDRRSLTELASAFFCPAALSMSFMHCKNVVRTDATETEGPPPKWLRRMKQPTLRYHVLEINPMKEVLRKEGGSETNGLKKALHICRGHFATYTPDKPLFGRISGTVWKPAHVRGSKEFGEVKKDYEVNAP